MERESSQRGKAALEFHDWPDEVLLTEYVYTHDARLFSEIAERHKRMIWSECQRVTHHRQDAESAAQNTWLVFLQKATTIHKGESLKHWLRSAALGEARNLRKKNGRRRGREQLSGDLAHLAQLHDAAESREALEIINTEVQRLPEKLRIPFVLRCLEGKSKREAAQELGLKEGTVASRVRKARELLQQRLTAYGILAPREPNGKR